MAEELNYNELSDEIVQKLRSEWSIILATCANDKVTARAVCHVNDGLTIMFSTNEGSEKVEQMKQNPNVALAVGNIRIEATAEIVGNAENYPSFIEEYRKKFPEFGGLYGNDYYLIIAKPTKISLYKYIDGPREDVLNINTKTSYRI
ncbi:MAG: pyridoxamine 5'-phosphate oxidase family protein [Oscillospiraceae bacterium]|nr:pyridoxamine 5'-phosphate oxidase family protein [Oscillospiraceae bacterium]